MRSFLVLLSLLTALQMLGGCGEDNPLEPTDPDPVILEVQVPAKFWVDADGPVMVTAMVTDAQGLADIDSVWLTVLKSDSVSVAVHKALSDSGLGGDLIPFDGVYSTILMNNTFTESDTGICYFLFQAIDGDGNRSRMFTARSVVASGMMNEPPQITEIILPEVLSVDASIRYGFNVRASDPQGMADLDMVIFRVHNRENPKVIFADTLRDDGNDPDAQGTDGIFSGVFTPAFADSVVGIYPFTFQAIDKSGVSTDLIRRDVRVVNESNLPPVIFNLSAPDTFDSKSATNSFMVGLEVMDPQGLSDIDSVYFYSLRPDGILANGGRPILMSDDGKNGDGRAGDGIYSFKAVFVAPFQFGNYTWTFHAVDRSDGKSNTIVHILTII